MSFIQKILGSKNDREIKKLQPRIQAVNSWSARVKKLSDSEISSRIAALKNQVQNNLKQSGKGKLLRDMSREQINDALTPVMEECFALVREAGERVLGMRHYDVQLVGGMVLNSGRIAEMRTGEGKTLVATLPAVLNTLTGGAVHVVTVNDYLASRDAEWMGRIYRFLGISVGVIYSQQGDRLKKEAYEADITYGQNNEFGFDYLRDNMKFTLNAYKQRGHAYAIIDEVDSILIDEARTPLIISGPAEDKTELYVQANGIIPNLRKDEDYTIDEKSRNVLFTESGVFKVEKLLGVDNLYEPDNIDLLHHTSQALRAHTVYKRDADYVVNKGEVLIVDEHTGRLMQGRRWSDGLHGAIEAKENVKVQKESVTLATVTFQNYFRMYTKLSGMTGTADTEASEFAEIYNLDVIVVPTNRPIQRDDQNDLIFKTEEEKVAAVVQDIVEYNEKQNPILVGTTSVEKSEVLARELKRRKIPHSVLNAKKHKEEAGIVAQAGRLKSVTIATNMAGRGTDILLGGSPEFMAKQDVAKEMGDSVDQIAQYAFLSGRPDLILPEKLAQADKLDSKYLNDYYEKLEAMRQNAEENGVDFDISNLPQSEAEARDKVYEERLAFYKKSIEIYAKYLEIHDVTCKAEKAQVLKIGGLRIIGTERHESRRIDNQLRGRAGRQGDPGSSRFYLSLQDDLMRIFGSERMIRIMEMLGMEEGVPIEHKRVTKSIEGAQMRVEGMHFDSRKNVIEYDDVLNQQRNAVYTARRDILEADPGRDVAENEKKVSAKVIREMLFDLAEESIVQNTFLSCPDKSSPKEWDLAKLSKTLNDIFGFEISLSGESHSRDSIMNTAFEAMKKAWNAKTGDHEEDIIGQLAAQVYLETIDTRWKEHLQLMDHLREGIHLRGYGQKDPKQEYKKEGFRLYQGMRAGVRDEVLSKFFNAQISSEDEESRLEMERMRESWADFQKQQEQQTKTNQMQAEETPGKPQSNNRPNTSMTAIPQLGSSQSSQSTLPPLYQEPSVEEMDNMNRAQKEQQKQRKKAKVDLDKSLIKDSK